MIAKRILATLSALFLVSAVALASFGTRALTLEAGLRLINRGLVDDLLQFAERTVGNWPWTRLIQPLLVRPAWLPLAALGLICVGLVVTLSYRSGASGSHRRG